MRESGLYFNEHDRFAAEWLRNLYPDATVDERDIRDVTADDVVRFRRVHFFGGIGGWQYALDLAGWGDEEIWTGSCPCQPFSSAGKRKGVEDERHLWPEFRRLIEECRPATVIGEQVASKDGREWLAGVRADLEALGYAVGAADLCAPGTAAPHLRQRLFWVGHSDGSQCGNGRRVRRKQRSKVLATRSEVGGMADSDRQRLAAASGERQRSKERDAESRGSICGVGISSSDDVGRIGGGPLGAEAEGESERELYGAGCVVPGSASVAGRLGNAGSEGLQERDVRRLVCEPATSGSPWEAFVLAGCSDDKTRRISSQRGDEPLAHGIPSRRSDPRLGLVVAGLQRMGHSAKDARRMLRVARANRVGRLRGYGNAIVPQVAATFIRAFMEARLTRP